MAAFWDGGTAHGFIYYISHYPVECYELNGCYETPDGILETKTFQKHFKS